MKKLLVNILLLTLFLSVGLAQTSILVQDTTYTYLWQDNAWQFFKRVTYADFRLNKAWKSAVFSYYDQTANSWHDSIIVQRTFYSNDSLNTYFKQTYSGDTLQYNVYTQTGSPLEELSIDLGAGTGTKVLYEYDNLNQLIKLTMFNYKDGLWSKDMCITFDYQEDTLLSNVQVFYFDSLNNSYLVYCERHYYTDSALDSILYFNINGNDTVLTKKDIVLENLSNGDWKVFVRYVQYNDSLWASEHYWRSDNRDTLWIQHWYNGNWIDTVEYKVVQDGKLTYYVAKKWYLNSPNPLSGTKQIYQYQNGKLSLSVMYFLSGTQWIPTSKKSIVYNDDFLPLSEKTFSWDEQAKLWLLNQELVYQYDMQRLISKTYIVYPDGVTPQNYLKDVYLWHSVMTQALDMDNNLRIFPVPAYDFLQISGLDRPAEIEVYNLNGQKVATFQGVLNNIDVSGLKPGVYLLQINHNVTKRFIKL